MQTKSTHPIYIYSVKNNFVKVNSVTHKDKNVDIINNAILPCFVLYTVLTYTRHINTRYRDLIL